MSPVRFKPQSHWKHQIRCARKTALLFWSVVCEAQILMVSASLAFTTLLALVPMLALSFAVFKAVGGTDRLLEVLEPFLLLNLAPQIGRQAVQTLTQLVTHIEVKTVGLGGLLGLLITSMSMLASVEKAIHRVWDTPNRRPVINRISTYWLFVTLGPLLGAVVLGWVTSQSDSWGGSRGMGLPSGFGTLALTFGVFFFVYRWVPYTAVHTRPALLSAGMATALFHLARGFYPWYTREILTFDHLYGGIAALPLLMLWIQVLWIIVLGGAALSRALQE